MMLSAYSHIAVRCYSWDSVPCEGRVALKPVESRLFILSLIQKPLSISSKLFSINNFQPSKSLSFRGGRKEVKWRKERKEKGERKGRRKRGICW